MVRVRHDAPLDLSFICSLIFLVYLRKYSCSDTKGCKGHIHYFSCIILAYQVSSYTYPVILTVLMHTSFKKVILSTRVQFSLWKKIFFTLESSKLIVGDSSKNFRCIKLSVRNFKINILSNPLEIIGKVFSEDLFYQLVVTLNPG